MHLHEDLSRQSVEEQSSEREFGLVFAGVFTILGLGRLYQGHTGWMPCFVVAAIFLLLACFWTLPLRPLNKLWHRFGLLLFRLVNPLIMGSVFFSTISPIGLLMRALGKNPLELKFDREAPTYWEKRIPPTALSKSMKNQF